MNAAAAEFNELCSATLYLAEVEGNMGKLRNGTMFARFQIGDAHVTQIVEFHAWPFHAKEWFPGLSAEQLAFARQRYPASVDTSRSAGVEGPTWFVSSRNYVVEIEDMTIVVDACCGNGKRFPSMSEGHQQHRDYLARFAAAGFDAEQIDIVISTHLHFDHVGWYTTLVDGKWRPTFANATYLFDRVELENIRRIWRQQEDDHRFVYEDSIVPVLEQAQYELLPDGDAVIAASRSERVVALPAPGHTPGQRMLEIKSVASAVILTGDMFHHPIEAPWPDLVFFGDADPEVTVATRLALFNRCADEGIRLLTPHLVLDPDSAIQPPVGVTRDGRGAFDWV